MKHTPPTRTTDPTDRSDRSDLSDRSAQPAPAGWLFYDAECAWCRGLIRRWGAALRRMGFEALPLQTPGTAERLGVTQAALLARMHLLTADGRRYAGADAYVEMARARAWSRPLAWISAIPGVTPLLRRIYDQIAARRHCLAGACQVELPPRVSSGGKTRVAAADVLPLLALPAAGMLVGTTLAPWVFMWLLAISIFGACKWLTLRSAGREGLKLSRWEQLGYLVAWVGMEPREFERTAVTRAPVAWASIVPPLLRVGLGLCLLFWGTPRCVDSAPLMAGWLGMIGIILILHFGLFDLLALAWRGLGYPVKTLMNAPTRARSVGNFWSARWNRAFHALVQRFVHRALLIKFGAVPALLGVFLVSGGVHDLVLSIPAGGGYGRPTLYFLIQGLALWFERSVAGRLFGLGSGWLGRAFAIAVVVGPLGLLFPPVFIRHVILPMLDAIGAT